MHYDKIVVYRSDGQVVSVTVCTVKRGVFEPHMNAGFQCGARSLRRSAFYDAITGLTEFIISLVNSVNMDNVPRHDYPTLKEGKSLGVLFL